jgi:signal transduction histidine kinase
MVSGERELTPHHLPVTLGLIEGAIKVRPSAVGDAVARLPWICPSAGSLAAMARASGAWAEVRADPGAVILLARHASRCPVSAGSGLISALLENAPVLDNARALLEKPSAGLVDWARPGLRPVYCGANACARMAHRVAETTGKADPECAWLAGMIAALGWLAVSAADPERAAACFADPALEIDSRQTQEKHWGIDSACLARRLARRWQLPDWLGAIAGHLELPVETACSLSAEPELFMVVQCAVGILHEPGRPTVLGGGAFPSDVGDRLGMSDLVREALREEAASWAGAPAGKWDSPYEVPLLRELLALAVENRALRDEPTRVRLERDVDALHHALEEQRAGEAERLQARKLAALAEFAAGAGHEINNPLAVISGQAQYLLGHEADRERQHSLQTIIGQTQRIHQILRDLMQFARPSPPRKEVVNLPGLVREVADSLCELAAERHVRLLCPDPEPTPSLSADPSHLRAAITCLVRNAIEAAPAEGWAGVRLDLSSPRCIDVVVEDNGPGLPPPLREHLFDPFYSGREAGRGRGLGLSTAWRLVKVHGGDLRFVSLPDGPTRFVISLPYLGGYNGHQRGTGAAGPHEERAS